MPYKPSQIFGADVFALTPPQLRQRARTIPRLSQRWQARTHDAFTIGDAFPDSGEIGGIEHMRIVEIDPEIEIPGEACEIALTGEGIPSGETWMELDRQNQSPDVGWDQIGLEIYTRDLTEARWAKGERLKRDALTGIDAAASSDVLTKVAHGLVTGQLLEGFTFGSGFGGLASGSDYVVHKIDADTFHLCLSRANAEAAGVTALGTDISITGTAATDVINATAHGLNNGDCGTFPVLNGGTNLTALTVPYYVVEKTTDTFKVSLTPGGAAVDFTSAITSGSTFRKGTYIPISSDGTGASATPLVLGHELMFITGKNDRPADAQDYHHLDLELKGLLMRDGDSKPIVRQWETASGKYTSRFDGLSILTGDIYSGFPPVDSGSDVTLSGTNLNVEYELPALRVTDTMVTTTEPDANWLYRFWTPEDAPAISLYTMSAEEYLYRFPFGWKLVAMNVQVIPGKRVWLLQLTFEKVTAATPVTTSSVA